MKKLIVRVMIALVAIAALLPIRAFAGEDLKFQLSVDGTRWGVLIFRWRSRWGVLIFRWRSRWGVLIFGWGFRWSVLIFRWVPLSLPEAIREIQLTTR